MDVGSILLAKIAGLLKNFRSLEWGGRNTIYIFQVEHLIEQFVKIKGELISIYPELFADLPQVKLPAKQGDGTSQYYTYLSIHNLILNLEYILEVHSNYRIGERQLEFDRPKKIFISHGTSKEWLKVQVYLEKVLEISTLELEQQANLGRTILQKLSDESSKCGYALIVMTGDDKFEDVIRARENVLHEIGFFQGKYGLQNIILLHESGVNIPSNIHGLVYIPFPKDSVDSSFGALTREIKTIFN